MAEEQRNHVQAEQDRLAANAAEATEAKAQAERDLQAAEPALEMAKRALDSIRPV